MTVSSTPAWVRWTLGVIITTFSLSIGFVYGDLSARMDRSDARLDSFATASLQDRRDLATAQAAMSARQIEQYDRIMSELTLLRAQLEAMNKRP